MSSQYESKKEKTIEIEITSEWVDLRILDEEIKRLENRYQPAMTAHGRGSIWINDLSPWKQRQNPKAIKDGKLKLFFIKVRE
jgi:hypothetical protein